MGAVPTGQRLSRHYPGGHDHDQTKHGNEKGEGKQPALTTWQALANEAQQIRSSLLLGAVEDIHRLSDWGVEGGINASDCAVATVGGVRAFLKKGGDAPHEYAACVVSRMLGMDGRALFVDVPETVLRKYGWQRDYLGIGPLQPAPGQGKVSFAEFRDGETGVVAKRIRTRELYNLAVFDALIGQTDRHRWNRLVDDDGHVVAIDHGFAFADFQPDNDTAYDLWRNRTALGARDFFEEQTLYEGMTIMALKVLPHARTALEKFVKRATTEAGRKALRAGLSEQKITAMLSRAEEMLRDGYVLGFEE